MSKHLVDIDEEALRACAGRDSAARRSRRPSTARCASRRSTGRNGEAAPRFARQSRAGSSRAGMALTHLLDSSALTRLHHAAVRDAIEPAAARGELARAGISDLEIGYSARSTTEWDPTGGGPPGLRVGGDNGRSLAEGQTSAAPARGQAPAWPQGARPSDRRRRGVSWPHRPSLRRGLRSDRLGNRTVVPVGCAGRLGRLTPPQRRRQAARAGSSPDISFIRLRLAL